MNKYFLWISICICAALISCSRDKGGSVQPEASYIKLNVAGKSWNSDGMAIIGTSAIDGTYNFTLSGSDQGFEGETSSFTAIFSSPSEITTGTYILDDLDGYAALTKLNGKTYMTGTGNNFTIQITEVSGSGNNKKFKGTFSGQLKGPSPGYEVTVSNGEFSSM